MLENSRLAASDRDPRLDFFRGIAMFIIFVSHTPGNWWINWIPARFGFSDSTEIFVFCSGMASAIAFGRIFETQGLAMGTVRILHRVWQVYWAHIALFFAVTTLLIGFDRLLGTGGSYANGLNLALFFDNARAAVFGLLTLTYVPNYFDILPMYLGMLLMVPLIVWLHWHNPFAPFFFCAALWIVADYGWLDLPAEPWSDRTWFFNPFSWQLVFFTGFAIMRGWLPTPPVRKNWMIACGVVLALCLPFSSHKWLYDFSDLQAVISAIRPLTDKTHFGLFRYAHFLALAYLAYSFVTILGPRFSGSFVDISRKVGQQSLGVFLASLILAQTAGTLLKVIGPSYVLVALVNLMGFAGLVAVAHVVGWYKSTPWKTARPIHRYGSPIFTAGPGAARRRWSQRAHREFPRDQDFTSRMTLQAEHAAHELHGARRRLSDHRACQLGCDVTACARVPYSDRPFCR